MSLVPSPPEEEFFAIALQGSEVVHHLDRAAQQGM
jgi:hypothetical protein